MNRLDTWKFAAAAAVTLVIANVACAVALAVSPDATVALFNTWMHGIDLARLMPAGGKPVTVGGVMVGALAIGVIAFVAGAVLAALYNWMLPRADRQMAVSVGST